MSQEKIYWRSVEELTNHPDFLLASQQEFNLPTAQELEQAEAAGPGRRDFLKMVGFGLAATSLAACEAPVRKAIPFLAKPDNIDYSYANFYASSYMEDGEYCSILVKTKEGRPIKIEGNKLSSVTRGGTSAKVQAAVLDLYDTSRFKKPQHNKKDVSWDELDAAIGTAMREASAQGKAIRLVTPTIASPSFLAMVARLQAQFPTFKHVIYDVLPAAGILKANQASFGQMVVPSYDFSRASVIVSLDADFLGTWLSPIEFAKQFAKGRKLGKQSRKMSKFYAVEPLLSMTGANADQRVIATKTGVDAYTMALYMKIVQGQDAVGKGVDAKVLSTMVADLEANRGRSLVVAGSNDPIVQQLVNTINYKLGNYGATINLDAPLLTHQGTEAGIAAFAQELAAGQVGVALLYKTNPVFTHPQGAEIKKGLASTTTVALSYAPDETTDACQWVAPDNHFLESWGDAEPKRGFYSLTQPSISPLFATRQVVESLAAFGGQPVSAYDLVRQTWRGTVFGQQSLYSSFEQFWSYTLHDGIFEIGRPSLRGRDFAPNGSENPEAVYAYVSTTGTAPASIAPIAAAQDRFNQLLNGNQAGLELVVYEKVGIGNGARSNNPWLLELPDPISRITWENYVTLSPSKALELGVSLIEGRGSKVKLTAAGKTLELPAVIQPGQDKNTVGLALGFGRTVIGAAGKDKGVNAYPFVTVTDGVQGYLTTGIKVEKVSDNYDLGHVQTSHTNAGRPVIQESTLVEYQKKPDAGREYSFVTTPDGPKKPTEVSLWKTEVNKRPNHAWGMSIDLNSCIGCHACVVACTAENNVPVVGKQEVVNRREMHWLRIDRYYSSQRSGEEATRDELETAAENPEVTFQPMLCQHCNNAPCETVCPVLATTHSTEGLNQMTYNRCIGTRYCANNCPYKVRRFNWFAYPEKTSEAGFVEGKFPYNPANALLTRMVLNPDVTVRARGVMEKCSFCIQRIQDGKLNAKKEGRRPIDGEVVTACAQACPTEAIVFGDMNDPASKIAQTINEQYSERAFHVLEEINTRPNVNYLTKIRNKA